MREKMSCSLRLRLRLLLLLSSGSVALAFTSGSPLVVKVAQSVYQAEENANVTLEWTFSPRGNLTALEIFCVFSSLRGELLLYHMSEGAEVPQYQDAHFRGRLRSDPDAVKEGRVSLHLSPLSQDDSGVYQCNVFSDVGRNSGVCRLNVTAATGEQPRTHTEAPVLPSPEPERRRRYGFYAGLLMMAALIVAGLVCAPARHANVT